MAQARPSARTLDGRGLRIALVTAQFNPEITRAMRDDARARARALGADVVAEAEAPGSYDVPLVVQECLLREDVDGVVALGAIVQGETRHDELIAHACAQALLGLALRHRKPVGLGITGPGQTEAQARARVDRAGAAVESIVKQLQTLAALRRGDDGSRGAARPRVRQHERRP